MVKDMLDKCYMGVFRRINYCVNFFISNKKELPYKFGKWFYYHDSKCKVIKHDDKITIYHGYVIDAQSIEHHIVSGSLKSHTNGNFFVVTMHKDRLEVIVDFFSQHKIFYRDDGERLEVSNKIFLFPFMSSDIDNRQLYKTKREALMKNHMPLDTNSVDRMERYRIRRGKDKQSTAPMFLTRGNRHTGTIFKHTFILPTYHSLELTDKSKVTKQTDLVALNYKNLFAEESPLSHSEVEDIVFHSMEGHADIIKQTYRNIVSSVSEGVDSILQDCFFPDAEKITYTYDPPATTDRYKRDYLERYASDKVHWDTFPVDDQKRITKEVANDPEADFFDTLPTAWQVKKYKGAIDVLLYGQMGDNMFLHHPWYTYTFMMAKLNEDSTSSIEQKLMKYKRELEKIRSCYSSRETLDGPEYHSYNARFDIGNTADLEIVLAQFGSDWKQNVAQAIVPSTYTRDLIHSCDVPVVSLYADKRIFNLVHSCGYDIVESNMREAQTQKNILQNRFNYKFITPVKDGAYFNMHEMVTPWYLRTVEHCMKDHLLELCK